MAKLTTPLFACFFIFCVILQAAQGRDKSIFQNAHKIQQIALDSANSTRFIVIGDWGGLPDFPYRTPIELAVAKRMGIIADQLDAQFVLALGDNFYFDGVKDVDDPRFQETYDQVFNLQSLTRPWYLVAGNHDHNGNISAQIAYSAREKRWNYPNMYYKISTNVPGASIDILMIDTVTICGNSDDRSSEPPQAVQDKGDAEDQWTWLQTMMESSKANYLIVAGHYPVYSIAEHGPTACLVERLEPMLHKYNATSYMCGHDHNIQHLQNTENGVTVDYFLSGASNFIDASTAHKDNVPANVLKFHWADLLSLGAFGHVEATRTNMTFSFVEANGKLLHQHVMKPRKV